MFYHVVLGLMQGAVRQDRLNQSNSLLPLKGHSSEPALLLVLPLSEQIPSPSTAEKDTKREISAGLVSCIFSLRKTWARLPRYSQGWSREGWGEGDGKKPLPSVIWELLCQFTSLTECPFKGCWHTTFVSSVLRVYMKHPGTVDGIQWQHKLDET